MMEFETVGFEEWAMCEEFVVLSAEIDGIRYFIDAVSDEREAARIARRRRGEVFSIDDVII